MPLDYLPTSAYDTAPRMGFGSRALGTGASSMEPATMIALGGLASNVLGGLFGAKSASKQRKEEQARFEEEQRRAQQQAIASLAGGALGNQLDTNAADARNMYAMLNVDPFAALRAQQKSAVSAALAQSILGGERGTFTMPKLSPDLAALFSPEARLNAQSEYLKRAGAVAPGGLMPDLSRQYQGTGLDTSASQAGISDYQRAMLAQRQGLQQQAYDAPMSALTGMSGDQASRAAASGRGGPMAPPVDLFASSASGRLFGPSAGDAALSGMAGQGMKPYANPYAKPYDPRPQPTEDPNDPMVARRRLLRESPRRGAASSRFLG